MAGTSGVSVALKLAEALENRKSTLDTENSSSLGPVIYNIDPSLRELQQEHFNPTIISLGLFDFFKKKPVDILTRTGDALKVDVLIKFLADIGETSPYSESWLRISTRVVCEANRMKALYDGHSNCHLDEEGIRSALALDAIFLASFLEHEFYPQSKLKRGTDEIFLRASLRTSRMLLQDIFKLENQIPLGLIRNVIRIRYERHQDDPWYLRADVLLNEICRNNLEFLSSTFPSCQLPIQGTRLYECHHLLHCQAKFMWSSAEEAQDQRLPNSIRQPQSRNRLWDNMLPIAKRLCLHGIKSEEQHDEPSATSRRMPLHNRQLQSREFLSSDIVALVRTKKLRVGRIKSEDQDVEGGGASAKIVQGKMPNDNRKPQSRNSLSDKTLPKVKDLRHYGIKFEGQDGLFPRLERHRIFCWKATLFLPKIERFDRRTEGLWRNLLAFEDAHDQHKDPASASFRLYLEFMDQLIDDKDDIALLCAEPNPVIGGNTLGDNNALAELFNSIMRNHFVPNDKQWASIREDIVRFHNQKVRRKVARFMAIYSDEPWLFVSLIAATILLVLTVIQTIKAF